MKSAFKHIPIGASHTLQEEWEVVPIQKVRRTLGGKIVSTKPSKYRLTLMGSGDALPDIFEIGEALEIKPPFLKSSIFMYIKSYKQSVQVYGKEKGWVIILESRGCEG